MNEEKFFKELGISSDNFWEDAFCVNENDKKLLLSSKDMLIALIMAAMQFNKYAIEHFTKGKMEKWGTNNYYFKHLQEVIEKATYKTWNEIIKIWEECQE